MALLPSGSGSTPVIAEVEMNGGADQSASTVRATVVQASTVFYDTPATLDKAERLIAEAAGYGSQLVVFPEAFVGGYPRGSTFGFGISISMTNPKDKGKGEFQKYLAAAIDVPGPEVTRLAAMAGKYKVFLVMGVIEREGYTLYCSVLFFDPLGRYLGKHRKLMPTALERIIWGFGDGSTIPVYDTPLGKSGALICWENKMPLLRTALYGKGIEIYCAPTADSRPVWQASMTHIALEGGCFVLSANQFCRRKDYPPPSEYAFAGLGEEPSPDTVVCPGGSVIISPSGEVLAGPNYDGEALITADLDKAEKLIAEAAGYGSQLVLFPEVFVGGYPHGSTFGLTIGSRSAKGKEDFRKYHAAAIDVPGPEVSRLAALAGKYKVFLVIGVVERAGYTLYNTVLSFDSLGKYLGKHRKLMPTALERVFWGFGDGSTIPVYDTPLGKIGAVICWENRMPLIRTAMYAKGVQIYCAPTADALPSWQASMTHIALEGGCFVLTANQFCRRKDFPPPPEYTFGGHEEEPSPETAVCPGGSAIISPSGTVLAGPNYEGEALLTADLDLGEIVRAKFDFDVVGHYARPEVLSLTVKTEPKHAVSFTSTVG